VSERRPFALLRSGDQWVRCTHDATFLDLASGVVELAWTTTTASVEADSPALVAGLAFDSNCRLLHALPDAGRVERLLWAAVDPAAPPDEQPAAVDLFEAPPPQSLGDFSVAVPATGLVEPRGLAVDMNDRLFVAETGADRILVYDLWDERLLQHTALAAGSRPTDLAANGQSVYAVLAGTGQVARLAARTVPVAIDLPPGCVQPSRVAISPAGQVAILAAAGGAAAHVWFIAAGFPDFDATGATDIEWESDMVLVVARQPGADFIRLRVGSGLADLLPPLRARGYDGLGVVALPAVAGASARRIGYWTALGPRTAVPARLVYAAVGRLTTYRLDSGAYQTEWGRVFIDACIPPGSEVRLSCIALDETDDAPEMARVPPANVTSVVLRRPDLSPPMPPLALVPGPGKVVQPLHRRESGRELPWTEPGANDPFATYEAPVIAGPGRYLWLTLELRGNTRVSPKIKCLRAEHPAHDYLKRLPRTFSRDAAAAAFLQRWLAMFEGFLGESEARAVDRDLLLAPRDAPDEVLPWLASFVGLVLDERWANAPSPSGQPPADVRRQYIEEAVWLFRFRGTVPGLKRFIEVYTGIPVVIVEHYRLRGLGAVVLGEADVAAANSIVGFGFRVGGEVAAEVATPISGSVADAFRTHAHRFTVIIPAALSAEQIDVVQQIITVHRPAHTLFDICTIDAGMRVGHGLLLEVSSVIGRSGGFASLQLGGSTLGRGTVVGRAAAGGRLGSATLGRSTQVG
jgi:phage tail-like protein